MSDSVSEEPSCSANLTPPKKAKVWYKQAFKEEWMAEEEFKDWVKPDPSDKYSALCSVCNTKMMNCNKTRLLSHKASSKHVKNCAAEKKGYISMPKWKQEWDKARKYKSKYAEMFPWVKESPAGSGEAYCRICCCNLSPKVSALRNHEKSMKHKRKVGGESPTLTPPRKHSPGSHVQENGEHDSSPTIPFTLHDKSLIYIKGISVNQNNAVPSTPSMRDEMAPARIGFIGCGSIAQALMRAFLAKGLVDHHTMIASAPTVRNFSKAPSDVQKTHDNNKVVQECDIIFICVKCHMLSEVVERLEPLERERNPLFVSAVTGYDITTLEQMLGTLVDAPRVIRIMPNSPCLIGKGCCVYIMGSNTNDGDTEVIHSMLSSVGYCAKVVEDKLDAVCGLAVSGPAYIFAAIKALADGGVKMGLSRQMSQSLAAHMVKGAAAMVLETGKHPGQLEDEICAPPGTTISAMHLLEKNGFRNSLISAVEVSATCSRGLWNPSIITE